MNQWPRIQRLKIPVFLVSAVCTSWFARPMENLASSQKNPHIHKKMRHSPPPCLSPPPSQSMRSGGAIPPLQKGISAILARYPKKTRQMGAIPPSAILSRKGIARYGGVSRTGPLRAREGVCGDFWGGGGRGPFTVKKKTPF